MSAVATARPVPPKQADGPSPRKRRKRASAAGAADDCFTCSSRGYKCDRRRPYCSQCLDDGKDCAGYKTQLTWGVGVASRGKLRGLSLPVAGTKKATPAQKPRHRQSASTGAIASKGILLTSNISIPSPASSRSSASNHREKHSTSPPLTSPFPCPWETPGMPQHSTHNYHHAVLAESPVSPMAFPFPPPNQAVLSPVEPVPQFTNYRNDRMSSIHSVYPSPASDGPVYTQPQCETMYAEMSSYSQPPQLRIPIPSPQTQQNYAPFTPFDTAFDSFSPYCSSLFPRSTNESYQRSEAYHPQSYSLSEVIEASPAAEQQERLTTTVPLDVRTTVLKEEEDDEVDEIDRNGTLLELANYQTSSPVIGLGVQLPTSFTGGFQNIGSTSRLQYLINYYAEVISPVIVAFDSPSNPFRTHILRLATDSEALQYALGGLAASNLRQRRSTGVLSTCKTDPARRSSLAHLSLSNTDTSAELWDQQQHQATQEETVLKNRAIALLNQHLSQPVQRLHDSTLAVLLILCLFHMCDTGVAKFSTQFKGVRKLLALRKASGRPTTKEGEFCTRMFVWWDGVTSSVNEREGILAHALPLPSTTVSEVGDNANGGMEDASWSWSLEHLAGIDTSLFRIMSRLGRLNVLAQGGDVEKGATIISRPPPPLPSHKLPTRSFSLNTSDGAAGAAGPDLIQQSNHPQFDGNGWLPLPEPQYHYSGRSAQSSTSGAQSELFQREVAETQHLLSSWSPPSYQSPSGNNSQLSPAQHQDLVHISLTFYHATQLYLLRLQHPTLPSSSPQIQNLVANTLAEVDKVKADVYLLWPLFVAGSECTSPRTRASVLKRVGEIQGDSGFVNNGVVGGVLESVWRAMDAETEGAGLNMRDDRLGSGAGVSPGAGAVADEHGCGYGYEHGHGQGQRYGLTMAQGFRWAEVMRHGKGVEETGGEYIVV